MIIGGIAGITFGDQFISVSGADGIRITISGPLGSMGGKTTVITIPTIVAIVIITTVAPES